MVTALRSFAFALAVLSAPAEEGMPSWVLPGILAVESRSRYADGEIVYVDRRVGAAGELGPFQITPAAFREVARPGEAFRRLRYSPALGEAIATRLLERHYAATGSWVEAVIRYHVGAHGLRAEGWRYYLAVRRAGVRFLTTPL